MPRAKRPCSKTTCDCKGCRLGGHRSRSGQPHCFAHRLGCHLHCGPKYWRG